MVPHAAPLQPVPPTFQVTAVFAVPLTAAENCCVLPDATVALVGFTSTATTAASATLRVAALLVALPALLLTTATNNARLSASVVGGVVYAEEVAPLTAVPFFNHW
jgi:hypothetical protein